MGWGGQFGLEYDYKFYISPGLTRSINRVFVDTGFHARWNERASVGVFPAEWQRLSEGVTSITSLCGMKAQV